MKIATIRTNNEIINAWREQVKKVAPSETETVLLDELKNAQSFIDTLISLEDDVVYTLPVHTVHSLGFIESLKDHDFVGFKQSGNPQVGVDFFAATNTGLRKIRDYMKNQYQWDDKSSVDANMNNIILGALGEKAMIVLDNQKFIVERGFSTKGAGQLATNCGGSDILRMVDQAKLRVQDVIPQLMETVSSAPKKVEYREQ